MKRIICLLLSGLMILGLAGCSKPEESQTEETQAEETQTPAVSVARNDWYGAISRILEIRNDTMGVLSILDNHNYNVIMGNPQDYWSDDYFMANFNPVDSLRLYYATFFNETQDWATIEANVKNAINPNDTNNTYVNKIEKHHYRYSFKIYNYYTPLANTSQNAEITVDCIYDENHNWAQMSEVTHISNPSINLQDDLYEFAELEANHYVIQTITDRLYIVYDENGDVDSLYYSSLADGPRKKLKEMPERSEDADEIIEEDVEEPTSLDDIYEDVTECPGNRPEYYCIVDDTIFTKIDDITPEWVFEEPTVEQYIIYKNGVLMVNIKNKLNGEFESFMVVDEPLTPVLDAETGIYYDPLTGAQTSMEEYNQRLLKVEESKAAMEEEERIRKENKASLLEQYVEATRKKNARKITLLDLAEYYRDKSEIVATHDVETSENVQTEKQVLEDIAERGFKKVTTTYDYSIDGEYLNEQEAKKTEEKHPIYRTYYTSKNKEFKDLEISWEIITINGSVIANPVSYNEWTGEDVKLIYSESDVITSYDKPRSVFYETIPDESELNVNVIDKIDVETLDEISVEMMTEITEATSEEADN